MRTLFIFFACLFFSVSLLWGQTEALKQYVDEGLANNLVLKQKNVSLDKALLALQSAKSMYLPSVGIQAAYSTASGGRNIALPLGDLLNPIYTTLNQITGSADFPMLENQSINFLPKNYYDAKIRTTMPLINTDITYNKKINQQQVTLQGFEVDTYARELVKNIKSAYFSYLNARKSVSIYQSALQLALESKRTNERLLENGKGLPAYVLRANSEVEQTEAQLTQARQQEINARLYFNALLNRDGDRAIDTAFNADEALSQAAITLNLQPDIHNREELKSLQQLVEINENLVKMNKKFAIPKLSGFVDLGSQAEQMHFNDQSRYIMLGVQFDLPLYSGNRNRNKIREAQLDVQDATLNQANIKRQLEVSSHVAKNNLVTAWKTYQSALKQLEAATAYQRLIDKGYQAGSNTYIETIDARNQLTMSRLSAEINKYNVLIAEAELEREVAAYSFNR